MMRRFRVWRVRAGRVVVPPAASHSGIASGDHRGRLGPNHLGCGKVGSSPMSCRIPAWVVPKYRAASATVHAVGVSLSMWANVPGLQRYATVSGGNLTTESDRNV
jgi:hypothetical protein